MTQQKLLVLAILIMAGTAFSPKSMDHFAQAISRAGASGPLGLVVSSRYPQPDDTQVPANADIIVEITGGGVGLDPASVVLELNGQMQRPSISNSGAVTTIKAASTTLLPAGSSNRVTLAYADSAVPANRYTIQWSFQAAPIATLPIDQVGAPGSGDVTAPGFKARVYQVDETGTNGLVGQITFFEQALAGFVGPNTANPAGTVNGSFNIDGTINWNTDYSSAPAGNFLNDTAVPGLPGSANAAYRFANTAAEILTFVEFPAAGFYALGVNSGDGFRVTTSPTAPANTGALVVKSPPSVAGSFYAVTAGRNQTGGIGLDITNAITGQLVYADPPLADADLTNAEAIRGQIALIDRGKVDFQTKLERARAAGAIAVVMVNDRTPGSADGIYPVVLGGNLSDIPAVMIGMPDGNTIKTALSQPVTATLTPPDYAPGLFQYDGIRQASDSIIGVNVAQAGLYPFRCVWMQCADGGSLEWFSVLSDGTRILLNDPANPKALKTYRGLAVTPARTTLSYTAADGQLTLTFTGTLQSAPSLSGPFSDVVGAYSPVTVLTGTGLQFYRARGN